MVATTSTGLKASLKEPKVFALIGPSVNFKGDGSFIEMLSSPNKPPNGTLVSDFVELEVYSPGKSSVASGGLISVKGINRISRVLWTFTKDPEVELGTSTDARTT